MDSTDVPTDFTNAMKTGVDLNTCDWPIGLRSIALPKVVAPGEVFGELATKHRKKWLIEGPALLVSGATDSNAAFYASGCGEIGDWSTTIGTTLAVKGLASLPINDSQGRIYCHRHPDGSWLPGGASNAGGEIFNQRFGDRIHQLNDLTELPKVTPPIIYPSIRKGERLPFADPHFTPFNFEESKEEVNNFLGCLEGLGFIERMTYELLQELGAEVGSFIYATGGAASSRLGLNLRALVLQRSLKVPQFPHSAMGAGILAASGYFKRKVGQMSAEMVRIVQCVDPPGGGCSRLEDRYLHFKELCQSRQK